MNFFKKASKVPENILEQIRRKNLISRYLLLIISLFISALVYNLLFVPTKIVAGGAGGVAIITEYLFNWEPSLTIFTISVVLLVLSFIFLGLEKTSGIVVATFIYPVFISLTAPISKYISLNTDDLLIMSIFGAIVSGITSGITFKVGFSNGGLNIISQLLYKYLHISISKSNFVINAIVVLVGGIYFGWTMVMYAIIILYINSLMIDKVLLGVSKNKAFYIITSEEAAVKEYIMKKLNHSVTVFQVEGGYLEKKRNVLMSVVPTKDYFKLTEGIKLIDKEAFFVVNDAYQVSGGA